MPPVQEEDISEKDEREEAEAQGPEALRNSAREVQRGPAAPGCAQLLLRSGRSPPRAPSATKPSGGTAARPPGVAGVARRHRLKGLDISGHTSL